MSLTNVTDYDNGHVICRAICQVISHVRLVNLFING